MAEQIAKDPSFAQMTQRLQASVKAGPDGAVQMDQSQYMSAMQDVMSNPNFMGIAEKLGNALMQVTPPHHCLVMLTYLWSPRLEAVERRSCLLVHLITYQSLSHNFISNEKKSLTCILR